MKRVVVRYQVREDAADENVAYIEKVMAELAESQPDGLKYAAFKADDGVTFIHVASIETADESNPLDQSEAFKQFQTTLRGRLEVPPQATWMSKVGSYGIFED